MAAKRTLNVHEELEYLEHLEVTSSDESDFKDEYLSEGRLVIVPPSQVEGRETEKDSGEENGIDRNHLNKNQLLSNAHVKLNTSHGNVSVGITDSPVNKTTKKKKNAKENKKNSQKPKLVSR